MQIALHIGAHSTDHEQLIQTLAKNGPQLGFEGIAVPAPNAYRKPMQDLLMSSMKGEPTDSAVRKAMLDAIGFGGSATRALLSHENLLGRQHRIFEKGKMYPVAPRRLADLMSLLPVTELQVYMAIRNPVLFVADSYPQANAPSFAEFMDGVRFADIRWSDMIAQMAAAVPQADFTVWCHEDTPLIWGDVLRDMAGVASDFTLNGEFNGLKEIMTEEGFRRMTTYIQQHTPQTPQQRQRIISAFLDKFALTDALEQEIELPNLDDPAIERLTAQYEADLDKIAALPGVRLIQPAFQKS